MGMAMDVFYGTGSGENITSRILKGAGTEDVVAFLVREYGAGNAELAGVRERTPRDMVAVLRRDEHAARAFARLLVEHGGDALARLDQAVEGRTSPEHAERLGYYRDLRRTIRRALGVRHARVRRIWALKAVRRKLAASRGTVEAALVAAAPSTVSRRERPSEFLAAARGAADAYTGLRDLFGTPELDPAAAPFLSGPLDELEVIRSELDATVDTEALARARREMSGGLRRAMARAAADGTLVMDQPAELVAGLESVGVANLQGWHHWQLDGWRSVLAASSSSSETAGRAGYEAALDTDMAARSQDEMRRIIQVMVQSPAGYRAVFGDEGELASIRPALDRWRDARATAEPPEEVDVDQMLADVHDRLPPPAMEGIPAKRKTLATDLYARGYYDVALAVAGERGAGP
jgi:hypothetical protein